MEKMRAADYEIWRIVGHDAPSLTSLTRSLETARLKNEENHAFGNQNWVCFPIGALLSPANTSRLIIGLYGLSLFFCCRHNSEIRSFWDVEVQKHGLIVDELWHFRGRSDDANNWEGVYSPSSQTGLCLSRTFPAIRET